ncbi:MAG: ABC transporter permease subunit, partial [Synergistes sp.]|nr:ABC transporter permease subunit [Synergistes sp.]
EGGFPYMFPDPKDPDKIIGYEVDIVEALCKEMGYMPKFIDNDWNNLIPGLKRGMYDIAVNGLEVTPGHKETVNFSIPYYKTFLQLAVRSNEDGINSLEDLKGKIAGTLKDTYAETVLKEAGGIEIRTYKTGANAYDDLTNGRIDAALYDHPVALYTAGFNPEIKFVGDPIGESTYAIALRKQDKELLSKVNRALAALRDSGKLREIYDKWNLWTPMMAETFNDYDPPSVEPVRYNEWAETQLPQLTLKRRIERYIDLLPQFGRGAIVTMEVSISAMAISVALGLILAVTRVFAPHAIALIAAFYIEVVRGTPVLIQLFFIFYGLPSVGIKFSPFWAGAIGL